MEQLNRIELRGNVGNIRISEVGESKVARFSVATNFIYKGKDNEGVVETTWHNVVAWSGKGMPDFTAITKGAPVYVTGRIRTSRFTGSDGTEKTVYEVVASKIEVLDFQA
ncbi:MAG: single-stranded DNA-binding protein [Bacteroidetes bacterium]|uniref:Single-stranded DNA-binding protein n=1 Tax=Candidatus Cryptobacteroides faecavium TaxID=2840762 RepID=A0A9D9IH17_9BACT|nr:single-stranded DNA-binding protein [Candidatus Cryptobacteroides faecavium]